MSDRSKILGWISTIPYTSHHRQISEGRLDGTGEWFLAKDEYRDWRESSASKLLLLRGIRKFALFILWCGQFISWKPLDQAYQFASRLPTQWHATTVMWRFSLPLEDLILASDSCVILHTWSVQSFLIDCRHHTPKLLTYDLSNSRGRKNIHRVGATQLLNIRKSSDRWA